MAEKKRPMAGKKPAKRRRGTKLRRGMLRALDLPVEMDPTVPKLTVVGKNDLLLENHTGVLQCADTQIRLTTHEGVLIIQGAELVLLELADSRAYVRGLIGSVSYAE